MKMEQTWCSETSARKFNYTHQHMVYIYIYIYIHIYVNVYVLFKTSKIHIKHLKRSYMFRSHDHPQEAYIVPY